MSQRRAVLIVAAVLLTGGVGWFLLDVRAGDGVDPSERRDALASEQTSAADSKSNEGEIQELRELVMKLQEDQRRAQHAIHWQATTNPPVGTILAYAGEWPPKTAAGEEQTEEQMAEALGWMRCTGGQLPKKQFPELYAVLQHTEFLKETETHFHLPDLCGYFLRGIDTSGTSDTASRDPDGHRRVGHVQAHALASHQHFVRLDGGAHGHNIRFDAAIEGQAGDADGDEDPHGAHQRPFGSQRDPDPKREALRRPVEVSGGDHMHQGNTDITGGAETRPVNIAVHFIIKVKSN